MDFCFDSVVDVPQLQARAIFVTDTTTLFKEDGEISPIQLDEHTQYVPWGADNLMPYNVLKKIEADETLTTCQQWNAEVCYGQGLQYDTCECSATVQQQIKDFFFENGMQSYFLGACLDFKHFGFCVTLIILSKDGTRITTMLRKEACNCRFTPAGADGTSKEILFANWEHSTAPSDVEHIPLLNIYNPWTDLQTRLKSGTKKRKFAIVTRIPTARNTYYPIPYYAAIFNSRWYDIKQLITTAKKAKLQNAAPIKYQIEVNERYWERIFRAEGITDPKKRLERVNEEKQRIIDFLTGAENSGKVWFSSFGVNPNGEENHDVLIKRIDDAKEGGDWETDIQEAINVICFTMRVHSNLVGSVPGKSQSNNSGSDKRELYTIAQALQKPYHDLLFYPHQLLIRFNHWDGAFPTCPFIQLTTLDEHKDAKEVTTDKPETTKQ